MKFIIFLSAFWASQTAHAQNYDELHARCVNDSSAWVENEAAPGGYDMIYRTDQSCIEYYNRVADLHGDNVDVDEASQVFRKKLYSDRIGGKFASIETASTPNGVYVSTGDANILFDGDYVNPAILAAAAMGDVQN